MATKKKIRIDIATTVHVEPCEIVDGARRAYPNFDVGFALHEDFDPDTLAVELGELLAHKIKGEMQRQRHEAIKRQEADTKNIGVLGDVVTAMA